MKNKIIIVLVIIAIGIAIALTYSPTRSTYKIGVLVPLTGKSASFGERVQNGVNLALADLNEEITVIFEDDKGEAPLAVSAANKLINIDKVKVIIGTVKSDAMLAVAPIAEKNKIILFSPTAGATTISDAGDYIFRNIETPGIHGDADAQFFKNKGVTRAAVFIANASNAQGYGNAFIQSFASITSTTTYNQDETDQRTNIAKALKDKPEGIYLGVATAKDAGFLVKQIRELGFRGLIMASVAADAPEFFDTAGAPAEGTHVSTSYFNLDQPYNDKYKAKFGKDSDAFAANAYDATMLLYNAMKKCKENTDCIRDYLYQTQNYEGVSGTTSFNSKGDVVKPVQIKIAQSRKFVPVK